MALRVGWTSKVASLTIFLFVLLICATAIAQESVKRAVFEDCERARSEFSKLTVEQQSSLLDFLARIIALSTQSPSAPEAYAVAPGTQMPGDPKILTVPRGSDLIPGALWQSMDAKRELRAKRCVLDILESAGSLSLPILPSLVSTYSEQPLSDEIAVGVEEVTVTIAEVAHLEGHTLDPKSIEAIVPHTLGPRPLVARNVVHEFKVEALPYLVSLLATKGEPLTPDTSRFLRTLDPEGDQIFRTAINLLPGLSVEQTRDLMAIIPLPSASALAPLVKDLIRLAADSAQSQTFAPLVGRACVTLGGITVEQVQQEAIAGIPQILIPGAVSPAEAECLTRSSPSLAKKVTTLLSSTDTEQQRVAIGLCTRGLERGPAEIRNEAYSALRRVALDVQSPIWREAIGALAAFPERKGETLSILQQLTRKPGKAGSPVKDPTPVGPIFDLLNSLNIGRDVGRFSELILNSLRSPTPEPGALLLAKRAPTLDPAILSLALSSPPTKNTLAALDIVASRRDISLKALLPLIELLRYPESSVLAEKSLISIGKPAVTPLRKAIPRIPNGLPRTAAFGVLSALGAATKSELHSATTGFATLDDCTLVTSHAGLLCSLSKHNEGDRETKQLLTDIIHRCISSLLPEDIAQLVSCNSEALLSAANPVGTLLATNAQTAKRVEPLIASVIQKLHAGSQDTGPLLAQLLRNGPMELKERILTELMDAPSVPVEVQEVLLKLSSESDRQSELAKTSIRVLALAGNTQFPWQEFVKRSISSASANGLDSGTVAIIRAMPVDAVLSEVLPALESEGSDHLIGAALVGAALGPKAIPLVSRLWHLRTKRSPAVRYTAALALLEINPLTPDMHDTVKKILANRFFETASTMPIRWADTVAVNDLERGTLGTLRKERLAGLLSPLAIQP